MLITQNDRRAGFGYSSNGQNTMPSQKKTAYLAKFYDFPRLMKASIYDDMQLTSYFKMTIFVMINIVNNTCRKIRVF